MNRTYDPTKDEWEPMTEGDFVDYNPKRDRYRANGIEFDGDYFRRQEVSIRFAHAPRGFG
jgi:hypothetical protein